MSDITITRDGRIATVSFDRGTPANPLSIGLMRDLTAVARSFEDDASLSAVILTGRADNFCLGFDLRDAQTQALPQIPLAERRLALQVGARMCRAWEQIEALTIAAIDGWCVGGGVALAVSLDLRIAAPSSTLYVPEVERGLNMSWGSIPRITNLIGPARAKRVIVLAEQVGATQAEHWGLLDGVARDGAVRAAALYQLPDASLYRARRLERGGRVGRCQKPLYPIAGEGAEMPPFKISPDGSHHQAKFLHP